MHLPIEDHVLAAIRRSFATGPAYSDEKCVNELAKKLNLDLTIRPLGRPSRAGASK
jgi:hypothetical protein